MVNKAKTTLCITAYNSEANIKTLLFSLLKQNKFNSIVASIIVYSDNSSDATVMEAKKVKNKRLIIIHSKVRLGFAGVVKKLLKLSKTEIVVLLNDDIKIEDKDFITKLIKPFYKERNVGLVTGHPLPLKQKTFIEAAVISSINVYENMCYSLKGENNLYTCDGKILALSKEFISSIEFPKSIKDVGNLDTFLYFSCLTNDFKYRNVKNAKVFYRCPNNLKDYIKWYIRNNADKHLLLSMFGDIVSKEYQKPKAIYLKYALIEFIKNPLGCAFIFLSGFYINFKAKEYAKNITTTWDTVESTKNLN